MGPVFLCFATNSADTLGQYVLELFTHGADSFLGGFPVNTAIGYSHAVLQVCQVFRNGLATPVDVAFHHQALDGLVAFQDLVGNVLHHQRLNSRVFAGVGVAAVHHDGLAQVGLLQSLFAQGHTHGVIVGLATATTKHHVAIVVALGADNGAFTLLVNTQEAVRVGDRLHGVNGNVQAAVGAVLEADSHRQAAAHFTVGLGFRGTGSDGRPGDGVLQVLRRNRIQRLGCRRQAQFVDVEQQAAADVQALFDIEGIVQVRIEIGRAHV